MRSRIRRQCYYDARVNDVNLEEITSSESNANILRLSKFESIYSDLLRIHYGAEQPDIVYKISLHPEEDNDEEYEVEDEDFVIREGDDMGWLGYFLGRSKYLERLSIFALPEEGERFDALMEGITRNKSITKLLIGTELGDAGYHELGRLFRSNRNLLALMFYQINIGREHALNIVSALRQMQRNQIKIIVISHSIISEEGLEEICQFFRSQPQIEVFDLEGSLIGSNGYVRLGSMLNSWHAPNLKQLDLVDNSIDNRGIWALVPGMTNCSNLEIVKLSGNDSITAAGLRSLSILFQRESCSLRELWLERMNIGDDGAAALAEGLVGNKSLQKLFVDKDLSGITNVGWAAFSKLLCDTSSINSTYLSNHTLQSIGISGFPEIVKAYLGWNTLYNKHDVAILKVIRYHRDLDMETFFQWKLKFLPLLVTWFDRARQCAPENARIVAYLYSIITEMDRMKLSSVYQFVRDMPMLVLDGYQSQTPLRRSKRRKLLNGESR